MNYYLAGKYVFAQGRVKIGSPNIPPREEKGRKSATTIKKADANFIYNCSCLCKYLPTSYPQAKV